MPVFLVGREYWQPIYDVSVCLFSSLFLIDIDHRFFQGLCMTFRGDYNGQYIKHADMNIVTVIGTSQHDLNMVIEATNTHEDS
jgi:hypothetical protein